MNDQRPKKRSVLFVVGLLLFLSGAVINFLYFNSFPIRSTGLLICLAGALLMRNSAVNANNGAPSSDWTNARPTTRELPGRLAWTMSGVVTLAVAISYNCLRQDALNGGHEVWPVYAFAISALAAAISWGCIVSKFAK